ncbi:hypothetical protein DNTS_021604 [Danionella cerebrum]|uniref:Ig-like domain-containing protein n=1 Tax=Danionella cerebrum TaxID=2873325 RepID=A0A553QXM3_9TELE|nr:hypothetical protein DNTS_021604 [Danionella translucida]
MGSCYQCFIDPEESSRLCWGHVLTESNIRNIDSCFVKLDEIFNNNKSVIEAGRVGKRFVRHKEKKQRLLPSSSRVSREGAESLLFCSGESTWAVYEESEQKQLLGKGYDVVLKEIMRTQIVPLVEEFDQQRNPDTVYDDRLRMAAENFSAAASKLPRVSGCVPPCGFQVEGAVYNCESCEFDSCELPLDCPHCAASLLPMTKGIRLQGVTVQLLMRACVCVCALAVQEISIQESNRTQMWCSVPFVLPPDVEMVWRYAVGETLLMEQFNEVTRGTDPLYSVPSARPEQCGTYQCEIFSRGNSIVRIYYHLTVVPVQQIAHVELQEVFEQALLPSGHFPPLSHSSAFSLRLPSLGLLSACLTAVLLLVFLTLG